MKKRDARIAAFVQMLRALPAGVRAECVALDTLVPQHVHPRGADYSTSLFYHVSEAGAAADDQLRAMGAVPLTADQWRFLRPHVTGVLESTFPPPAGAAHTDTMIMCYHDGTRWVRGEWTEVVDHRDDDDERAPGPTKMFYLIDALWWIGGHDSGVDPTLPLLKQAIDDYKAWQQRHPDAGRGTLPNTRGAPAKGK